MRFAAKFVEITSWFFSATLILRFVLKLFNASTIAPFVAWLYQFTDSLMRPFTGIFPSPTLGGLTLIDIPAIVALVVYFGGGFFLASLIDNLGDNVKVNKLKDARKNTFGVGKENANNSGPYAQGSYTAPTQQTQNQPQTPQYNPPQAPQTNTGHYGIHGRQEPQTPRHNYDQYKQENDGPKVNGVPVPPPPSRQ